MISGIIASNNVVSGPPVGVTWNPVGKGAAALSNGNLTATASGSTAGNVRSTVGSSGKFYFEVLINSVSGYSPTIGVSSSAIGAISGTDQVFGYLANDVGLWSTGAIYSGGVNIAFTTASAAGSVIMVAVDCAAGKLWFGRNGSWLAGGNPAAGTSPAVSSGVPGTAYAGASTGSGGVVSLTARFSIDDFSYVPPSGFSAL